jgi:hypothetical protein
MQWSFVPPVKLPLPQPLKPSVDAANLWSMFDPTIVMPVATVEAATVEALPVAPLPVTDPVADPAVAAPPQSVTASPPLPIALETQRLMAQIIALKAHNDRFAIREERYMARISQLTVQLDDRALRHDRAASQLENLKRQYARQRQRTNVLLDVTPVAAPNALSTPNPAVRNARGHYVKQTFWPRKQHQPIVGFCMNLVAVLGLITFVGVLGLVVLELIGLHGMVTTILMDLGASLARWIIATMLVSTAIAAVSESL